MVVFWCLPMIAQAPLSLTVKDVRKERKTISFFGDSGYMSVVRKIAKRASTTTHEVAARENSSARGRYPYWCGNNIMMKSTIGDSDDAVQQCANKDIDDGTPASSTSALLPQLRIGGPNTWLPFYVESLFGWSLCLSCLTVSGYHYVKSTLLSLGWKYSECLYRRVRRSLQGMFGGTIENGPIESLMAAGNQTPWIPLTTHSRAELERQSPWERYQSLLISKRLSRMYVWLIKLSIDEITVLRKSTSSRSTPESGLFIFDSL